MFEAYHAFHSETVGRNLRAERFVGLVRSRPDVYVTVSIEVGSGFSAPFDSCSAVVRTLKRRGLLRRGRVGGVGGRAGRLARLARASML